MDGIPEEEVFVNPFQLFPEMIWEEIIDNLVEIEDIKHIFMAFPPLRILSNGIQWSWRIGDVMPLIFFKFLDLPEITSCRLVSRRWKNAVKSCLESHTDHTLYKSSILQETHFNYNTCRIATNVKTFLESDYYKENGNVQIELNPFPGRNLHIMVEDETVLDDPTSQGNMRPIPASTKLSELSPTIHVFGHHICNIAFVIPFLRYANDQSVVQRIVKPMFQCLLMLPNLRSIQIFALSLPTCHLSDDSKKELSNLPQLSCQLEVLDLRIFHSGTGEGKFDYYLFDYIIKALAVKSRPTKLSIGTNMWRSEYAAYFPNVTEILLGTDSLFVAKQILEDLKVSSIRRMWIEIFFIKRTVWEILEVLESYQIESLELGGVPLEYPRTCPNDKMPIVKSLKCLRLRFHQALSGVSFNFLAALPSLEYLIVDIRRLAAPMLNVLPGKVNEENYNNDPLRTSLYNLFHKEQHEPHNFAFIWEKLPSLEMLTVRDYRYIYQYVRESPDSVLLTKCPRRFE